MLKDLEVGYVSAVLAQGMSRFDRNYLEVCLYTEICIPKMCVSFIAVNDGVDSEW